MRKKIQFNPKAEKCSKSIFAHKISGYKGCEHPNRWRKQL